MASSATACRDPSPGPPVRRASGSPAGSFGRRPSSAVRSTPARPEPRRWRGLGGGSRRRSRRCRSRGRWRRSRSCRSAGRRRGVRRSSRRRSSGRRSGSRRSGGRRSGSRRSRRARRRGRQHIAALKSRRLQLDATGLRAARRRELGLDAEGQARVLGRRRESPRLQAASSAPGPGFDALDDPRGAHPAVALERDLGDDAAAASDLSFGRPGAIPWRSSGIPESRARAGRASVNVIGTVSRTLTGLPSTFVGSYSHCRAAAIAASSRPGTLRTTAVEATLPCASISRSRMTMPRRP